MPDQITTKPFVSQAQAGWAFATGQPWARRWARETGPYKRLPRRKTLKSAPCMDCVLASLKGESLGPGITRIRGNLCNVHGRYGPCDAAGLGRGDSKVAPYKPPPKTPRGSRRAGGKGRAAAKPKKTDAQRRQEQEARRAQHQTEHDKKLAENRATVADALGMGKEAGALKAFADGGDLDPKVAKTLFEQGLVTTNEDGSFRVSSEGRHFLTAAERGETGTARDAIARGTERQAKARERYEQQQQREAERAKREAERKKKGGHGGKGKRAIQPKAPALPRGATAAPRAPQAPRAPMVGGGHAAKPQAQQIAPELLNAAQALSDGKPIDQATQDTLIRNGLARIVKGQLVLTATGLRAMRTKAYVSDQSQYAGETMEDWDDGLDRHIVSPAAVEAARTRFARALGVDTVATKDSPGDYLVVEDPKKSSTWHLQVRTNGTPDHRLMGAAWAALYGGYRGNEYTGPNKSAAISKLRALYASEKMPIPSEKSFAVFKDATGAHRWIARTTTAFEDRDQEVISTKALADDATRADGDGKYGPLRWWHLGRPKPLDLDQPWGPGVDLGWCDFNAVSGKTLIESGTFKSESIARAVAAKADELELSPGFFHAAGEPDASGVFHHIRRFERSLVPSWAGRASNPYTGLVVEKAMDAKKIEALKALGLDETTLKTVLADVQQAEKEAETQGVRYKASQPIKDFFVALLRGESVGVTAKEAEDAVEAIAKTPPEEPPDPLVALKAELESLRAEVAALKAPPPPPMDAEDDPTQGGDVGADEAAEGEPPIDDAGGDGGLTLSADDLNAIGQVIGSVLQAALEPLIGAMGITQKLEGHLGELKTMMGGYTKTKDDTEAARSAEIATLKARLDELLGDQPRASYRPTQATDNTPWSDPQVLASIKDAVNNGHGNGFEDLTEKLFPGILPPN
jgi:hypothetical protein